MWSLQLALAALFAVVVLGQSPFYNVPEPLIEALKPKGLRISIPDEAGVELFAIHANVNKPLEGLAGGQLSRDILKAKNGRWTYEDLRVRLKPGDTLNYWLYVQADGLGYRKDDQTFIVKELVDAGSVPGPTPAPAPAPVPTEGCQATQTTVNGRPSCKGQLIFEETFDSLNPTKWQHVVQIADSPGFEFVVYSADEKNSYVRNGNLHVTPTVFSGSDSDFRSQFIDLPGCTGPADLCKRKAAGWVLVPPVLSAQLHTKQTFSFAYGRVEIRAKLPIGDWIIPELWLKPKDNSYGEQSFSSGQIQVGLARGNRVLTLSGSDIGCKKLEAGLKLGESNKNFQNLKVDRMGQGFWSDEYHTYTVLWTPDGITFTVDGQDIGRVSPPAGGFGASSNNNLWARGTTMAPFDKEFYLSLGLGAGGFLDFPNNCVSGNHPKPWENWKVKALLNFWTDKDNWFPSWSGDSSTLQVDSVKVWAL